VGAPENLLNVVDVEATCWEGDPPPGEVSEIIEIGLCVVDVLAWQRVQRRGFLVRPQRSRVSEFCTRLTTLTPEQVEGGVTFAQACEALREELDAARRPWASWGEYDRRQFTAQCEQEGVPYPFGEMHVNLRMRFKEALGLARRPGMDAAMRLRGLELEGTHHRGEDDAWNIGALAIELGKDGWLPELTR
jgi:inhibitor of KinA sporulation pathway (predicted exonuclease)